MSISYKLPTVLAIMFRGNKSKDEGGPVNAAVKKILLRGVSSRARRRLGVLQSKDLMCFKLMRAERLVSADLNRFKRCMETSPEMFK
jgi:hypothetical protein